MNFVPVTIKPEGDGLIADAVSFQVTLPPKQAERARNHVGKTCTFGIRPEDIYDKQIVELVKPTPGNTITVDVDVTEPLGSDVEMYLKAGDTSLIAMVDSATQAQVGDRIEVIFDMDKSHLFDVQTEQALY
jgi:multiple sugar transport system ATP-binding protein